MTQPIVRIYESRAHAAAAVAELTEAGLPEDQCYIVPHPGGDRDAAAAAMVDTLVGKMVARARATTWAAETVQGGAILSVLAPFGFAATVESILDSHAPTGPAGYDAPPTPLWGWDESAVFSSGFFGLAVKYDNPTPISRWLNVPVLVDQAKVSTARFGWPMLSKHAHMIREWAMLSPNPAPLSSRMGWKVKASVTYWMDVLPLLTRKTEFMSPRKLIDGTKPFLSGFPMLAEKPFTLGNWPMLTAKLAPLSEAFQMPLLSSKQIFLSDLPLLLKTRETFPALINGSRKLTTFWPMLTKRPMVFGFWPALSNNLAPLSSKLSLPLLSAKTTMMNFMPMLAKEGTTLSGAVKLPLLMKPRQLINFGPIMKWIASI